MSTKKDNFTLKDKKYMQIAINLAKARKNQWQLEFYNCGLFTREDMKLTEKILFNRLERGCNI